MIQPDRITVADHLFIGESLAPLLGEIKQALSSTHPRLCARIREALDEVGEARAIVNRAEATNNG